MTIEIIGGHNGYRGEQSSFIVPSANLYLVIYSPTRLEGDEAMKQANDLGIDTGDNDWQHFKPTEDQQNAIDNYCYEQIQIIKRLGNQ